MRSVLGCSRSSSTSGDPSRRRPPIVHTLIASALVAAGIGGVDPARAVSRFSLTVAPGYTSETATVAVSGTPARHAYLTGLNASGDRVLAETVIVTDPNTFTTSQGLVVVDLAADTTTVLPTDEGCSGDFGAHSSGFSSDGNTVAFVDANNDLFIKQLTTVAAPSPVTSATDVHCTFSSSNTALDADGSRVAYVEYITSGGSTVARLEVANTSGSPSPVLVETLTVQNAGQFQIIGAIRSPVLSADGSRVAYAFFENATSKWKLRVKDISGTPSAVGNDRELTSASASGPDGFAPRRFSMSSDGATLAWVRMERITIPPVDQFSVPMFRDVGHLYVTTTSNNSPASINPLGSDLDSTHTGTSGYSDVALAGDSTVLAFTALTTDNALTGRQAFRLALPAASNTPGLIAQPNLGSSADISAVSANSDGSVITFAQSWFSDGFFHTSVVASRPAGGLTKPTASWSVTQSVPAGLASLGSNVTITGSTPDSGVTLSALLRLRRWSGDNLVDAEVTIPMTNSGGNTYSASYTLVENDARIVDATVTSSKGDQSNSKAAGQTSVDVGATFIADSVDLPDGEPGFVMVLSHLNNGTTVRQSLTDNAGFTLTPVPAGTHDLGVFDSQGRPRRSPATVTLRAGKTVHQTLAATPLASLAVHLNGDGGDMSGAVVTILNASGYLQSGATDTDGDVTFTGLPVGQELRVQVSRIPRLLSAGEIKKTLVTGANSATITTSAPPRFTLTGTVLRHNGRPAVGAVVSVAQWTPAGHQSFSAMTDLQGQYAVEILDGRPSGSTDFRYVDWAVAYAGYGAGKQLDLQTAAPGYGNFQLTQSTPFKVLVRILNQGSSTAQNINDPRVVVHLQVQTSLNGQWLGAARFGPAPTGTSGGMAYVQGAVGDTYRVCASGIEAGFGEACQELTLADVTDYQTLEMTLPLLKAFTTRLYRGNTPWTGDTWWQLFELSGVNNSIRTLKNSSASTPDRNGNLLIADPTIVAGKRYSVTISSPAGSKTVTSGVLGSGSRVSLGSIRLGESAWLNPDSTSLTTDKATVSLGSRTRMRLQLTPTENLTSTTLKVPLTTGVTYVAASMTQNGTPISSDRITTTSSGVTLAIGALAAGVATIITYDLDIAPGYTGDLLPASVELRFTPLGQLPAVEFVYGAEIGVSAVTMNAPRSTNVRLVVVSGSAPPGAVVSVTERAVTMGRATADDSGFWQLAITLADRGTLATYRLHASVPNYQPVSATVVYDEHTPVITLACMSAVAAGTPADAQTIDFCFDPRQGVATFPFIFVPGQLTRIRFTVDKPALVNYVEVAVGDIKRSATKQTDASHLNTFMVDIPSTGKGDLYARVVGSRSSVSAPTAYLNSLASAVTPNESVTADELDVLDLLSAIDVSNPSISITTDSPTQLTALIEADPTDPKVGLTSLTNPAVTNTLTFTSQNYTLTASDVGRSAKNGLAVYGITTEVITLPDGRVERRTVAYVDASGLPGFPSRRPTRLGAVDQLIPVLGLTLRQVGGAVFLGATSVEAGFSSAGEGDKWDRLAPIMDKVGGCLTPAQIREFDSQARFLANTVVGFDVLNSAINIVGVVAAPETFGLSAVGAWAAGWLVGKATDYVVDEMTESFEFAVDQALAQCTVKPLDRMIPNPRWRLGEPKWIYDPSGYAFEGAPEFRLPGVTATLLRGSSLVGSDWSVFDMTPYAQVNPLVTNEQGRYAWNVPEGFWKVQFSRDGYLTSFSDPVEVLPPQFEVHGSMVKETAPVVTGRSSDGRGLTVTFDQPMRVESVRASGEVRLVNSGGALVPGSWEPVVSGVDLTDGALLAKVMRFVPDTGLGASTTYWVRVGADAVDHTGRPMFVEQLGTVTTPPPAFVPLNINRFVDTRRGKAQLTMTSKVRLSANRVLTVPVLGLGGVPVSGVDSVALLVTSSAPGRAGALTVYPCDATRPSAPNVTFAARQSAAVTIVAKVSASGSVCIHSTAPTDVLVDVSGYFPTSGGFTGVNPARLLETRTKGTPPRTVDDLFWKTGRLRANSVTALTVAGRAGVPDGATSVFLSVTATGSSRAGTISLYPCGTERPATPTLYFARGRTTSTSTLVTLSTVVEQEGTVCVHTTQAVDVAVDLGGYGEPAALLFAGSADKLLDTLSTSTTTVDGIDWKGGRRRAGSTYELTVTGRGKSSASAPSAVLRVALSGSTAAGTVTVYPCGTTRPAAVQLTYGRGQSVATTVITGLGVGTKAGKVCLFTSASVHLRAELIGTSPV